MALRSVPVKKKLIQMVETNFPGFRFVSESGGIYGFVRDRPGYWYDYLPVNRYFQGNQGEISINWYWIGFGHVPDWYEWAGSYHTPWRVLVWPLQKGPDPAERPSPLASPGPDASIRYQTGSQAQLDQALEVLRDKVERYAIPALERPLRPEEERRLPRWRLLAEHILPQIESLSLQAPEELEGIKSWQKQTARRRKSNLSENVPPILACWREEIRQLPGFAEEWDSSPNLQNWVFNWFTHAFYLHP